MWKNYKKLVIKSNVKAFSLQLICKKICQLYWKMNNQKLNHNYYNM